MMDENWSRYNQRRIYSLYQGSVGHFAFRWPNFKRKFLSSNISLKKHCFTLRGRFLFGLNPLNSSRVRIQNIANPILDKKHRKVLFRTLSTKATYVFLAQFLLNETKRYFKGYAIIYLLSFAWSSRSFERKIVSPWKMSFKRCKKWKGCQSTFFA